MQSIIIDLRAKNFKRVEINQELQLLNTWIKASTRGASHCLANSAIVAVAVLTMLNNTFIAIATGRCRRIKKIVTCRYTYILHKKLIKLYNLLTCAALASSTIWYVMQQILHMPAKSRQSASSINSISGILMFTISCMTEQSKFLCNVVDCFLRWKHEFTLSRHMCRITLNSS